jgi:elongation factor 2 kinase
MAANEDGGGEDDEGVCGNAGGVEADPPYVIKARLAEMLMTGGNGLEADPNRAGDLFNEAAEDAAAAMKGRLANKYYMKAEEAYALAPAEEEEE